MLASRRAEEAVRGRGLRKGQQGAAESALYSTRGAAGSLAIVVQLVWLPHPLPRHRLQLDPGRLATRRPQRACTSTSRDCTRTYNV